MKKTIRDTLKITALGIAVLFTGLLTSCHDQIYQKINKEVKLEANGISGDINSIVRFNGKLYLSNGKLYEKDATPSRDTGLFNRQWKKVSTNLSEKGKSIGHIAADGNYIYAVVLTYKESKTTGYNQVSDRSLHYSSDGENWTEITKESLSSIIGSSPSIGSILTVMGNRAYDFASSCYDPLLANAYVKLYDSTDKKYKIYLLDGPSVPTSPVTSNNANENTESVVYFKGDDYFFDFYASAANDTYMYYTTSGSEKLYWANQLDYNSESGEYSYTVNGTERSYDEDSSYIYSIGVTADALILGTFYGAVNVKFKGTDSSDTDKYRIPENDPSDFSNSNNADSILNSNYVVNPIFVLEPDRVEDDTDTYAGITIYGSLSSSSGIFDETGLYAYYPARGYWNRDGTADDSSAGN